MGERSSTRAAQGITREEAVMLEKIPEDLQMPIGFAIVMVGLGLGIFLILAGAALIKLAAG